MKPKLILADDSLTIQKVISLTLENYAVDLTIAQNSQELEQILANAPYDVLMLDFNIHGELLGIEFVNELRQKYPKLKILPLLGTFDEDATKSLSEIEITHTVAKPFDGKTLINGLEALLSYSLDVEVHSHEDELINPVSPETSWQQEVPGIIGETNSQSFEMPGVIGQEQSLMESTLEDDLPTRFPEDKDLAYPAMKEPSEQVSSVKDEMTSKLVSLDELDPLGEPESEEISEGLDDSFKLPNEAVKYDEEFSEDRLQKIENQIADETSPDLWVPDENESALLTGGLSRSEVRLIAQEVIEDYMRERLDRALKDVIPDIAEKIINTEIQKISDRILKDDF